MKTPTFEDDARALGFEINGNTITLGGKAVGSLRTGADVAEVTVERSVRKPTLWAHLSTPLNRRSQMTGKAVIIVTVTCPDNVLIVQRPIKYELSARRFARALDALAHAWKVTG